MKILLIGDIVGKGGRRAAQDLIPELRREYNCSFCIANAENSAGGAGVTRKIVETLLNSGVDVLTSGDHVWDQKDFVQEIASCPKLLRPANFDSRQPGKGYGLFNVPIGGVICVINLIGRVFISKNAENPFTEVDRILEEIGDRASTIFVDFHAEATSEKIAMGRHLDGRVTAVYGTHTHVQTADEQIFPGRTAFICDLGMVGGRESILGREITPVLRTFTTGLPSHYKVVEKNIVLNGAVVEFDRETGRAVSITRITRNHEAVLGSQS